MLSPQMGALDEILGKWRDNVEDPQLTMAVCTFLARSGREELIREVGASIDSEHGGSADVMLALGRMYLEAGFFPEAQKALVRVGKLSPKEPAAYHYLGEVLLRRGDAVRARKILEKALKLGSTDADTRMWKDRADVYVELQERVGAHAVAEDLERSLPRRSSRPPPPTEEEMDGDGSASAPEMSDGVMDADEALGALKAPSPPPADVADGLPSPPPRPAASAPEPPPGLAAGAVDSEVQALLDRPSQSLEALAAASNAQEERSTNAAAFIFIALLISAIVAALFVL